MQKLPQMILHDYSDYSQNKRTNMFSMKTLLCIIHVCHTLSTKRNGFYKDTEVKKFKVI